jgi:hypothetical protein
LFEWDSVEAIDQFPAVAISEIGERLQVGVLIRVDARRQRFGHYLGRRLLGPAGESKRTGENRPSAGLALSLGFNVHFENFSCNLFAGEK